MKTSHGILALSAAAMLALAGTALAIEPAPTTSNPSTLENSPNTDDTGILLLGVDIGHAGNTPAAVQTFVSGLSPDQQRALGANCNQVLNDGSAVGNLTVLQFCHNLAAG